MGMPSSCIVCCSCVMCYSVAECVEPVILCVVVGGSVKSCQSVYCNCSQCVVVNTAIQLQHTVDTVIEL